VKLIILACESSRENIAAAAVLEAKATASKYGGALSLIPPGRASVLSNVLSGGHYAESRSCQRQQQLHRTCADYSVYLLEFQALLCGPPMLQTANMRLNASCVIQIHVQAAMCPADSSMEFVQLCTCHRKAVLMPADLTAPSGAAIPCVHRSDWRR
jgi:hypothetical protein